MANPKSLVRNTWAPREVSVSTMVSTEHQLYPTSLTTPTRAPVSSMTESFTSTPWAVPLFSVREEVQLVTVCSVTKAASKSLRSRRCSRRFKSSRRRLFSSLSFSA